MADRYANMQEDGDAEAVEECIQVDETDENFLDIIDNFDGMSDEDDEDVSFVSMGGDNEEDDTFDKIVGALEDIMMDDEFQQMQADFAAQHCNHFEATDENKLIYTEIFSKYTELIEGYLDTRLKQNLETFSMPAFMEMLMTREEEMKASDVFDVLVSCADFETFKELMLAHKTERDGGGVQLCVDVRALTVHVDEQEDGEERPDLDLNLNITPVASPKRS
mmetsp:Transcript_53184/g.77943  ORF Transcript_53184/g.77943 Transcript_53184/m.77943 type:complete len:221 (-) Transcript_53184:8-670(-)